jgi:hypothetical protein
VGMSVDSVAEEYYCNAKQLFLELTALVKQNIGWQLSHVPDV